MTNDSENNTKGVSLSEDNIQENEKSSEKKESLDSKDEDKIDKSLDEVSNVIHDLLTEPENEDANDKINETAKAESSEDKNEPERGFKKLSGLFKKKNEEIEKTEEVEAEAKEEYEFALDDSPKIPEKVVESLLEPKEISSQYSSDKKYTFDEFIDERILISKDAFGKKEMKIKVLEVSDEKAPTAWKLGDRVKLNKILVTVKHLETQEIEEGEFDIQSIEKELAEKRHYTSTNRWVPTTDIKNGYVIGARHTSLVSDAIALDYIVF